MSAANPKSRSPAELGCEIRASGVLGGTTGGKPHDLENLPQDSLDEFREHYRRLAEHARAKGFDLASVIAAMEAEKKLLRQERPSVRSGTRKARKRKLSLAVKGT